MERQTEELFKSGCNMRERRKTDMSALMWWIARDYLNENEKATLLFQDRPRSVLYEHDHEPVDDRGVKKDNEAQQV